MNVWSWICMCLIGIASGSAISGGVVAFLMKIGVFPRMIGTSHTMRLLSLYEYLIIAGLICGGLFSQYPTLSLPSGNWFVIAWGVLCGMYVGCVSAALAEVLSIFPILFMRTKIRFGMSWFVALMALGKTCGALWYFCHGLTPD